MCRPFCLLFCSSAPCQAHAGAYFAGKVLDGLNGVEGVTECAFVESDLTEAPFFASPVRLSLVYTVRNAPPIKNLLFRPRIVPDFVYGVAPRRLFFFLFEVQVSLLSICLNAQVLRFFVLAQVL